MPPHSCVHQCACFDHDNVQNNNVNNAPAWFCLSAFSTSVAHFTPPYPPSPPHTYAGVLPLTSGEAIALGVPIAAGAGAGLSAVRSSLGVCPQFDVLWPELRCVVSACVNGSGQGRRTVILLARCIGCVCCREWHHIHHTSTHTHPAISPAFMSNTITTSSNYVKRIHRIIICKH